MQKDHWGYTVTTQDSMAIEALNRALNGYFRFRTDAMKNLDSAIEKDPRFALPHAAKGILLESLKKPELHPVAYSELAAARNARLQARTPKNTTCQLLKRLWRVRLPPQLHTISKS